MVNDNHLNFLFIYVKKMLREKMGQVQDFLEIELTILTFFYVLLSL